MKSWQASMLVCDDLQFSLTGKHNLVGIYTGDIAVPVEGQLAPQLVFYVMVEGSLEERPSSLRFELRFPGEEVRVMQLPSQMPQGPTHGRTKWFARMPVLMQNVALKAGRIEASVVHGDDRLRIGAPWIIVAPPITPGRPSSD